MAPLPGLFTKTTQILVLHAPCCPPMSGFISCCHPINATLNSPNFVSSVFTFSLNAISVVFLLIGAAGTYINWTCGQDYQCSDIPYLPELFTARSVQWRSYLSTYLDFHVLDRTQVNNTQTLRLPAWVAFPLITSFNTTGR